MEVGRFHTDAEAQEKEYKEHERDHIEDVFRQEECGYTDHDARAYERDDKGKELRSIRRHKRGGGEMQETAVGAAIHAYQKNAVRQKQGESVDNSSAILSLAKRIAKDIDDLSILKIWREGRSWVLGYVTVFGKYDFCDIEQKIREESGSSIIMQKLDYSFENCVELICSGC